MSDFRYCFNTSTIRGQKLSLVEEIDIAAEAGYQAIEPWISEIQHYVEGGGSLPDLKKRIADRGLTVPPLGPRCPVPYQRTLCG